MTFSSGNVVTHSAYAGMFFKVVAVSPGGAISISPMNISRDPVNEWITVPNESALTLFKSRVRDVDGHFPTTHPVIMDTGMSGRLYYSDNRRVNVESYDSSAAEYTVTDESGATSTVARRDISDWRPGTMAAWVQFELDAKETVANAGLTEGTVCRTSQGQLIVLKGTAQRPDSELRYVEAHEDGTEGTSHGYIYANTVTPLHMSLEDYCDSIAPKLAVGNVVNFIGDAGSYIITGIEGHIYTALTLLPDATTAEPVKTFRAREIERVEVEQVTADYAVIRQVKAEAREAQEAQLMALSQNTVNRALAHASSNGYCSETLVALTSSGHKVPKIRVQGTLTIPIDILLDAKTSWETVRDIFGAVHNAGKSWEDATMSGIRITDHIDILKAVKDSEGFTAVPVYARPTVRPLKS